MYDNSKFFFKNANNYIIYLYLKKKTRGLGKMKPRHKYATAYYIKCILSIYHIIIVGNVLNACICIPVFV